VKNCQRIRPLLLRLADAEATPDEALLAARHLSDCTACRIQLARERRLAAMLEEDLEDPLQVGEEFVRRVMANLPQGPPPLRRRIRRRKMHRLAGLLLPLLLAPLAYAWPGVRLGIGTRLPELAAPRLDLVEWLGEGGAPPLGSLLVMAASVLQADPPSAAGAGRGLLVLGLGAFAVLAGLSTVLVVATHDLLRTVSRI
jgi:anti-sigma factor RsiW